MMTKTRPQPARTLQIVPSLLAADLARLGESLRLCVEGGVEWISVDVMDGHFVPNLSFGPDFVRLVKRVAPELYIDAHLMVDNPLQVAPYFMEAGADLITAHWEACREKSKSFLEETRRQGVSAGLAIKPGTPVDGFLELVGEMDLALVMTVEPGFGGAAFIREMLPRIRQVRSAIEKSGKACWLQVDGGINAKTVGEAAAAGADSLVAGTAVFGAEDIRGAIGTLRRSCDVER